ncbi:Xanthine phosphoribosyltransferase 1 [Mortierella sp. GBA30]|nr:Xanthine phosphoribosyltransferase 1 [Mortierella sp. GBA30]
MAYRSSYMPVSAYYLVRRRLNCSARTFTLFLFIVFVAINLLVYLNYATILLHPLMLEQDLPVERRETSPLTRSTRHPFRQPPIWTSDWFHTQSLDPALKGNEGEHLRIDIVYTWVNGSDPKLQSIKKEYENASPLFKAFRASKQVKRDKDTQTGVSDDSSVVFMDRRTKYNRRDTDQTANRFRDMDELKYSVRSVAQYATGMFERIHILATVVDQELDEGQVPSWLNVNASTGVIRLVQHDEIFEDSSFLPTFNSLAIESQMHHIPSLTDVFLYLNDDVFLGTQMRAADVWTPLYGFVFHMEPTLLVPPTALYSPENAVAVGEWNSLQYSNYLLSKQFGARYRAYLAHVPHVLSVPMLQEIQSLWPEDFKNTGSHRFRGEGQARDIQVSFFMAHYVMERLRETMLSSFWFHRLDANRDGSLDWQEREQLIDRIHAWNGFQEDNIKTNNPLQPYNANFLTYLTEDDTNLRQLGYAPSGSTIYQHSGLDGYPFMFKYSNTSTAARFNDRTPYLIDDRIMERTCQLDIDFCFGSNFTDSAVKKIDMATTDKIFQRMAFSEFHCGDCLLHILRQTSTSSSNNTNSTTATDFRGLGSEILPLDTTSETYRSVIVDLEKYNFVIATSSYSFVQLRDPFESQRSLNQILNRKDMEAFFCINDNVGDDPRIVNAIRQVFKRFLDTRFTIPSPWEKTS